MRRPSSHRSPGRLGIECRQISGRVDVVGEARGDTRRTPLGFGDPECVQAIDEAAHRSIGALQCRLCCRERGPRVDGVQRLDSAVGFAHGDVMLGDPVGKQADQMGVEPGEVDGHNRKQAVW
jgi:hypothetical protein